MLASEPPGSEPNNDELASMFMNHTAAAHKSDLVTATEGGVGAGGGPMMNTLITQGVSSRGATRAATALPGGYADEMERLSNLYVPSAESGDLSDPIVSNLPLPSTAQRHVTTNEPPLPEVPANMMRGKIGASGVVHDRARDHNRLLAAADVDRHRVLNSFHPDGMRLKEYDWNEGGGLGVHQGMGVRFDTQSKFNRYGRQVLPRDVERKLPLRTLSGMIERQGLPGPYGKEISANERASWHVPVVRENKHADFSSFDTSNMRGPVKTSGVMAMSARPDMLVHRTRRDNPEPRVTRLEVPYVEKSREHALLAQDHALAAQARLLDDGF